GAGVVAADRVAPRAVDGGGRRLARLGVARARPGGGAGGGRGARGGGGGGGGARGGGGGGRGGGAGAGRGGARGGAGVRGAGAAAGDRQRGGGRRVLVAPGEHGRAVLGQDLLLLRHLVAGGDPARAAGGPGAGPLVVHGRLEPGRVDVEAPQLGGLLGDLER